MAAVKEIGEIRQVSKTDESSLFRRLPSAIVSRAFGFCSLHEHLQLSRVSKRTKEITELKLSAPAKIDLNRRPSVESTEISGAMLNKIKWAKIFHASPSNRVLLNHLGVVGFFSSSPLSSSNANFQWEELSLNFGSVPPTPVSFSRNEQISRAYKWLSEFAEMQPATQLHTLKFHYPYYFCLRHAIVWTKVLKSFPSLTSLSASSFDFTNLELVRQLPLTLIELVVDWTGKLPSSEICIVLGKLPLRKLSLDVNHGNILTDETTIFRQWDQAPRLLRRLAPHLSKLEELRMIGCCINAEDNIDNKEWLVPQFKSLTHLTMGGVDTAFLTDHFLPTNGAQLKKLELHHRPINEISNLSDNSDLSISEMLLQCTRLEHLALVNYGLTNLEMAFIISESDEHSSLLHTLDLRENDIELTDVFSPLSNSLTSLFLSHHSSPSMQSSQNPSEQSTTDTVRTFPHLPALRNLQTSYLCHNLETLFSSSQFWRHFPNLESWDFSNSNIFFQVAKSTTSSTTSSSSLLKLNFQLCSFFPDYVGQVLQDHPQLRLLHLPRGDLSGLDCRYPVPPDALLLAESRGLQLAY